MVSDKDHLFGNDVKLGEAAFGETDDILDMSELDFGSLPNVLGFDVLAEASLDSFVDLNDYLMKVRALSFNFRSFTLDRSSSL